MADSKTSLERIVDALNILADDPLGSEAPGLPQHPYERGARILEAMVEQKKTAMTRIAPTPAPVDPVAPVAAPAP